MGATVCDAVHADPDLELVACVDPSYEGLDVRQVTGVDVTGLRIAGSTDAMVDSGVQVAVDFTHLDAARANLRDCATHGIHAVVGTSGFTESDYSWVREAFTRSNCVIAPNFAIGAV